MLYAENSMTGRAYLEGVLNHVSLAEIYQEMSELLDKQMNAQKESLKNISGTHASPQKSVQ